MRRTTSPIVLLVLIAAGAVGWLAWRDARGDGAAPSPTAVRTADDVDAPDPTAPVAPAGALSTAARDAVTVASPEAEADDPAAHTWMQVTVFDDTFERIHGARVQAIGEGGAASCQTGEDGACTLSVQASGDDVVLLVEAEGFFHSGLSCARGNDTEVHLSRAATMRGRVVDAESRLPMPGAKVRLAHECAGCTLEWIVADDRGRYEISTVPVGRNVIFFVQAEGYPPHTNRFFLPESGEPIEHDFALSRGIELSGIVVDLLDGRPLENARLQLGGMELVTDAGGLFRCRALPNEFDGQVLLQVEADGHCRLSWSIDAEALQAGADLRIPLPPAVPVEGVVLAADGTPVSGAKVGVSRDELERLKRTERGESRPPTPLDRLPEHSRVDHEVQFPGDTTGADGRFRTAGVVPWDPDLVLGVQHEQLGSVVVSLPTAEPGRALWVDVLLGAPGESAELSGRLLLNGKPVSGMIVWKGPTRGDSAFASRDGEFRIADVEPGDVVLTGMPRELMGRNSPLSEMTLHLEPGEKRQLDVALVVPTAPISGTVTQADGEAVMGAHVFAFSDKARTSCRTDESGAWSLDAVEDAGPYRIAVPAGDTALVREDVPAGTAGLDFVIPVLGQLRFKVVDGENGKELQEFQLRWSTEGDEGSDSDIARATDPEGWYRLRLPLGTYTLSARSRWRGYGRGVVQGVVLTDQPDGTDVTIALPKGTDAEVRLLAEPLPEGHVVVLVEADAWPDVRYWTSEGGGHMWDGGPALGWEVTERRLSFCPDGSGVVKCLAPGRYRFKVFPDDIVLQPGEVELPCPGPIELRWSPKE